MTTKTKTGSLSFQGSSPTCSCPCCRIYSESARLVVSALWEHIKPRLLQLHIRIGRDVLVKSRGRIEVWSRDRKRIGRSISMKSTETCRWLWYCSWARHACSVDVYPRIIAILRRHSLALLMSVLFNTNVHDTGIETDFDFAVGIDVVELKEYSRSS